MWNGDIKVITGLRRSGKSVLLFDLFCEYLLSQGVQDDHIIRIALDQRRFYPFRNPVVLCDHVDAIITEKLDERFYLLVDEVQFTQTVIDQENGGISVTIYDMLNELKARKNLDVYVTGSNSHMLSKDIATEFRGRATQIHVYPLSFREYYDHVQGDVRHALDTYMLYGGMPRVALMTDERDKRAYLSQLYEEVYIKDIVERHHLEREDVLNALLDYTASQIGSLTNPTSIANALGSIRREKITPNIVSAYLDHTIDAFLINVARRYDIKGKAYFNYPSKYYYTDIGLRNVRLGYRQYDPGHMMENIIYNELIRRGWSVDVGMVLDRSHDAKTQREIDFVVNDGDRRIYIQSAYQMDSAEKRDAETQSFRLTGDFFKKVVIRMDIPHSFYDDDGFFHCNLIDFLLDRIDLF